MSKTLPPTSRFVVTAVFTSRASFSVVSAHRIETLLLCGVFFGSGPKGQAECEALRTARSTSSNEEGERS